MYTIPNSANEAIHSKNIEPALRDGHLHLRTSEHHVKFREFLDVHLVFKKPQAQFVDRTEILPCQVLELWKAIRLCNWRPMAMFLDGSSNLGSC